ncbi:MAG: hypothetical protein Tsb002_15340 [Wenzhouxiangellaceae bacterium]
MWSTLGWVLFGFAVWGLAILLHALQRRFAPDMARDWGLGDDDDDYRSRSRRRHDRRDSEIERRDEEIEELKKRIQVLEAIVTDKKYQFDEELNRK